MRWVTNVRPSAAHSLLFAIESPAAPSAVSRDGGAKRSSRNLARWPTPSQRPADGVVRLRAGGLERCERQRLEPLQHLAGSQRLESFCVRPDLRNFRHRRSAPAVVRTAAVRLTAAVGGERLVESAVHQRQRIGSGDQHPHVAAHRDESQPARPPARPTRPAARPPPSPGTGSSPRHHRGHRCCRRRVRAPVPGGHSRWPERVGTPSPARRCRRRSAAPRWPAPRATRRPQAPQTSPRTTPSTRSRWRRSP